MIGTTLSDISQRLTADVLAEALRQRTGSRHSITDIQVSRATAPGEGLLSAVYRIRVRAGPHSANFIVKGLVSSPLLQKTLDCKKYFKREVDFFQKVIPVLCKVQESLGGKERLSSILPRCYACLHDGENDYILLEDMSESQCAAVSEDPSDEEKNRVLQTLAHFHAVSMALRLHDPRLFAELADGLPELYFTEDNREWYAAYLQSALQVDQLVMAEMEGADSVYYKKFQETLERDPYGQYIALVGSRGEHPVFCHGDSWAPNFLRSHDRMVVIDFQLVRCASPATDLAYWLMLCTTEKSTERDFLHGVHVYYEAMRHHLADMGFDSDAVFPRAALDRELRLYGRYGYLACLTSFPLMTADKLDYSASLEDKFPGEKKLSLDQLWSIKPIRRAEHKLRLRNAVRVVTLLGLI